MKALHAAGEAVIMVSHNLTTVRDSCQRVAWLDHGRLRAVGPADEVVKEYQKTFGAQ